MTRNRRSVIAMFVVAVVVLLLVAAYVISDQGDEHDAGQTPVTLFLPYVPSVQFAPAYVAVEKGYFADEGIAIELEHNLDESNGIERIANDNLQFGIVSGEQVVLARANARPVVYVFEWFHRFPVGIVSAAELDITEPDDLTGHIVGIPGFYGASYIGLRALLAAESMTEDDLGELRAIGYTAAENVCERAVDAAVVYIVNEPLTIEDNCFPVNVIDVSDYTTLVSNGLITNEKTIQDDPDLVRGMVRALQRGIADVIADPDAAFEVSVPEYVPDLPEDQYDTQRQVLYNSVELWRSDDLGYISAAAWEQTQAILLDAGLLSAPLDDLDASYTMDFLPD